MKLIQLISSIQRKMVRGHDDFRNYYCIEIKDWEKIKKTSQLASKVTK